MSYILSWYEKVNGEWVKFSREMSEEECREAIANNIDALKDFKKGNIYYQIEATQCAPFGFKNNKQENKPNINKPYYRKERW